MRCPSFAVCLYVCVCVGGCVFESASVWVDYFLL